MNDSRFLAAIALVFVGAALRLVDIGGFNFAPIGAIAVFCGMTFRRKSLAFGLPLLATLLGDVALAIQNGNDFGTYLFSPIMLFVYAGWLLYACCGLGVRKVWSRTRNVGKRGLFLGGGAVAGSVAFFVVTNLGVWCLSAKHSLATLTTCFVKAIPFYPKTLYSDVIYLSVLVLTYALATGRLRGWAGEKTEAVIASDSESALVYAD